MRNLSSTRSPTSGSPNPKRSKDTGTLATWRTNRRLEIIGATALPNGSLRSVPKVGQVISKVRPRRGILRHAPHALALRGKPSEYEIRLFHHRYLVQLHPRLDRRGRIVGVRGSVKRVSNVPDPNHGASDGFAQIVRKRHRNSVRSAIRSLELARAVADTARVNAEIRRNRAAEAQEKAVQARVRAEEEERRARCLADASAILDGSFDQRDTLDRLARMLVFRIADWIVISFLEDNRLRRMVALHRDDGFQATLEEVFPEEDDSERLLPEILHSGLGGSARKGWELFATLMPEDIAFIVQSSASRRRLKDLGIQSLVRTPIRSHGRLIGILMLGSGDPGRLFDARDLQMARDLAHRVALARESACLYEEAQREIAMRREIEGRMRVLNAELERRVMERTRLLEEATREANSFAYTVAHDLRAPLRAITGFCQALREDYSPSIDATGQDYLARIVTGAMKMDELIRDLLDYARINRAEIKRSFLELDPVIDETLQQMSAELLDRGTEVHVEKPLGRVVAQGTVLIQVLTNLISNGSKFVAPGVRPKIRIFAETRDRRVRLKIQDNGIGIALQHQERIFGIFERLNRAEEFPGTGIGLAIVRRAMERLGGIVGVESTPGSGSTFWIELPSA